MTIEQVKASYLNRGAFKLEPLREVQAQNTIQKLSVKQPIQTTEYAEKISEVHKLDERA